MHATITNESIDPIGFKLLDLSKYVISSINMTVLKETSYSKELFTIILDVHHKQHLALN